MTVKGARVVQKVDGQWFYPSPQLIETSTNGYSLLAKLTLPHIRVDEAMNSITALTNLGSVQVRINDVIASREDLQTLDLKGVEHIEYIDNPGVRYGEDVAYIINIKLKKPVSGYVIGSQLTNTLTAVNGNESFYAKANRGRSEFGLSYSLDYQDFKGAEYDELSAYELESGDIVTMHRKSLSSRSRNLSHNAQLTYSLSDSSYVLQAKLMGSADIHPQRSEDVMALNGTAYDDYTSSRNSSPSLDLYYHQDFKGQQSLTANVVGTFIRSKGNVRNDEDTPYRYDTDGHTYSLWSEAIYEKSLKPFTLSSGIQFSQRYSHNEYRGDAEATNDMHTSSLYLFGQIKGHLHRLSYMGGLGASRRYYRQSGTRQDFPTGLLALPSETLVELSIDRPAETQIRLRDFPARLADCPREQRQHQTKLDGDHSRQPRDTSQSSDDTQPAVNLLHPTFHNAAAGQLPQQSALQHGEIHPSGRTLLQDTDQCGQRMQLLPYRQLQPMEHPARPSRSHALWWHLSLLQLRGGLHPYLHLIQRRLFAAGLSEPMDAWSLRRQWMELHGGRTSWTSSTGMVLHSNVSGQPFPLDFPFCPTPFQPASPRLQVGSREPICPQGHHAASA